MERKRNEGFRSLSPAHFGELAAVCTSPQWGCVITSKNKHAGHVCLIFLSGDDTPKYDIQIEYIPSGAQGAPDAENKCGRIASE